MELIIGTISIVSLLFSIGLFAKMKRRSATLFGVLLFLAISFTYIRVYFIAIGNWEMIDRLNPFLYSYLLLFLPLIYLYVNRVLDRKTRYILHLLPFFVHFAFQCLRFTPLSEFEAYHSISNLFKFIFLAQAVLYGILLIRRLKEHDHRIQNQYSNLAGLQLNWMKSILFAIFSCGAIWLISWMSLLIGGIKTIELGFLHVIVLLIIFFLYNGMYTQRPVIDFIQEEEEEKTHQSSISLAEVSRRMEEEALYRNPELNLKKLAEHLSVPMREVSQVINREGETNFHSYVNSFRLTHVQTDLLDPSKEQWTILALALDAGFNSKSTFNAVFRKEVGMTPLEFKKAGKLTKKE